MQEAPFIVTQLPKMHQNKIFLPKHNREAPAGSSLVVSSITSEQPPVPKLSVRWFTINSLHITEVENVHVFLLVNIYGLFYFNFWRFNIDYTCCILIASVGGGGTLLTWENTKYKNDTSSHTNNK